MDLLFEAEAKKVDQQKQLRVDHYIARTLHQELLMVSDELRLSLQAAFEAAHCIDLTGQALAFAHQGLGLRGVIPQGRIFDPGIQFIEVSKGRFPVKDAS